MPDEWEKKENCRCRKKKSSIKLSIQLQKKITKFLQEI